MARSFLVVLLFCPLVLRGVEPSRPNILWITSEDNSPYLGCYGDPNARTPHLDQLASEGLRYVNAYSSAPVCSVARSTLITGMNAPTLGLHNHRSSVGVPAAVVYYPQLFRQAGYYCTNNSKTDYNMSINGRRAGWKDVGWHASGKKAHYRNRKKGQPFFAVFNTTLSHEGQTTDQAYGGRKASNPSQRILPPGQVPLGVIAPFHPDTPEIRENWSRYYDNMHLMDKWVGEQLRELEASGAAENTIVFYFSDHGGALPRGKRNIHDTGTRVPLIIRFPEKWKHLAPKSLNDTGIIDQLVAFVDFPAAAANLCGLKIPDIWEGKPFLGPNARERDFVYLYRGRMDERYDTVRAIRTKWQLYVRNFSPHRPLGQAYTYPFRVLASMGSWYEAFKAGKCNEIQSRYWKPRGGIEFYNTAYDPLQLHDAFREQPRKEFEATLQSLRRLDVESTKTGGNGFTSAEEALRGKLLEPGARDTGLIPEGLTQRLSADSTIYEHVNALPAEEWEEVCSVALKASIASVGDAADLLRSMKSESATVRYWAATGALVAGREAASLKAGLIDLLVDPAPDVRVVAAEALGHHGESARSLPVLVKVVHDGNVYESLAAANALEALGRDGVVPMDRIKSVMPEKIRGEGARVVEAIEKIR